MNWRLDSACAACMAMVTRAASYTGEIQKLEVLACDDALFKGKVRHKLALAEIWYYKNVTCIE